MAMGMQDEVSWTLSSAREENVISSTQPRPRPTIMHITFLCICLLIAAIAWSSLRTWLELAQDSEQSSSLWVVPLITVFLIYERRFTVFANTRFAPFRTRAARFRNWPIGCQFRTCTAF